MNHLIVRNQLGSTFINQQGLSPATVSIHKDHCLYEQTLGFTVSTPWQDIVDACTAPFRKVFDAAIQLDNRTFTIRGDSAALQVAINNQPIDLPVSMIKYIAAVLDSKAGINPILNFIHRLQKNPNPEIYQDLFAWVQNGDFVLTEDGCFLAYKKVRDDYKDIFTGSMDNSVGQKPEVPRHQIVRDREQTCAYGLHWCSWDYLGYYGSVQGYRVVLVKVAPEDVDRIPTDYDRQKGVSWTYEVIGEIDYAKDHSSGEDALLRKHHTYCEETGEFDPEDDSEDLCEYCEEPYEDCDCDY